uniref:Uncharacterized protein n=1 Tax=Percolomonas cosmopolitus TaxID=63605 RepID=A0A7S1KLW6_9EUKA
MSTHSDKTTSLTDTPNNNDIPPTNLSDRQYVKFFEEHGLKVKDADLAEEASRMLNDPYSLFAMWRWRGHPSTLNRLPDAPRCLTSLELEAIDSTPHPQTSTEQVPELFDEMKDKWNIKAGPKFSMATYMSSMQDARVAARDIKEKTGLDVYKKEDLIKVKELAESGKDEYISKVLPNANQTPGGLYIDRHTYRALYGSDTALGLGCWFDGPFYPKELRNEWLKNGDLTLWKKGPARLLDPKILYGNKLGSILHERHVGSVIKTMAWDKTKVGGKMLGFGAILWFATILVLKRYQLEYRDHITAQLVFADRLNSLDDYYPVTEASVHQQLRLSGWLQSYYEDEEDDDEL